MTTDRPTVDFPAAETPMTTMRMPICDCLRRTRFRFFVVVCAIALS